MKLDVGMHEGSLRRGASIVLSSGDVFYFDEPDPAVMSPEVIAHALSQLCRWTGHSLRFMSVAQHCVLVSEIVPPEQALAGLMHDASEAFIGDVSRPLKWTFERAAPGVLSGIEDRLHAALASRYGYQYPFDETVKHADHVSLATEKRDILPEDRRAWHGLPEPHHQRLNPWGPAKAERQWLNRYRELTGTTGS